MSACSWFFSASGRGHAEVLASRHASSKSIRAPAHRVYASIDGHSVSQELIEVVPERVDLDCQLFGDKGFAGYLDTAKLLKAENALSELWSECSILTTARFASLPLAARRPGSPLLANNQLAVHCHTFCEQLEGKYDPLRPGGRPFEFYVLACLCVKVQENGQLPFPCLPIQLYPLLNAVLQLLWSLDADPHLKAWICGVLLCQMSAAAGRLQVQYCHCVYCMHLN